MSLDDTDEDTQCKEIFQSQLLILNVIIYYNFYITDTQSFEQSIIKYYGNSR